jgi:leucyl aminopeptidase
LLVFSGVVDNSVVDAAEKGVRRAIAAGAKAPLVYLPALSTVHFPEDYKNYVQVALLGAMAGAYVPLQRREQLKENHLETIGVVADQGVDEALLDTVYALEEGRRVTRDIGGGDPERMRPEKCAEYLQGAFPTDGNVSLQVLEGEALDEYPLLVAVARASLATPRHHPRLVRLEYRSPDPSKVKQNLYFVGKGITYDTGGADLKVGGAMRGMSRDKIGAAVVAGLLKTVSLLKDETVNVFADLCFVRNSIGADAYVSDEVITSRAGVHVMVGNTDAEGRMVMADPLCRYRQVVLEQRQNGDTTPSHIFSVATLTGHVIRAYGSYGAACPNGPAIRSGFVESFRRTSFLWGDPFEVSFPRHEDYALGAADPEGPADFMQANSKPSTMTDRGHQFPAAFLNVVSGMTKNSSAAVPEERVAYTHFDISGCAEEGHSVGNDLPRVTGSPVVALAAALLAL